MSVEYQKLFTEGKASRKEIIKDNPFMDITLKTLIDRKKAVGQMTLEGDTEIRLTKQPIKIFEADLENPIQEHEGRAYMPIELLEGNRE